MVKSGEGTKFGLISAKDIPRRPSWRPKINLKSQDCEVEMTWVSKFDHSNVRLVGPGSQIGRVFVSKKPTLAIKSNSSSTPFIPMVSRSFFFWLSSGQQWPDHSRSSYSWLEFNRTQVCKLQLNSNTTSVKCKVCNEWCHTKSVPSDYSVNNRSITTYSQISNLSKLKRHSSQNIPNTTSNTQMSNEWTDD